MSLAGARLVGVAALLLPPVLAAGCAPPIDLKQALQVVDVTTGWFDAGIVDGKNKLVPSIAFRLKNLGSQEVGSVRLNVIFMVPPEWEDDTYIRGLDAAGLTPGTASDRFVVRAKYGVRGEQPRAEMLQHSQFRDARVRIFAKHGSSQWTPLGEFPVQRQLLTN